MYSFKKNSSEEAAQIVAKAIHEVIQGLTQQNNPVQQTQWKLKVCAALVAKLCEMTNSDICEDWTVDEERYYFEAVTFSLPAFTQAFLFDLVKLCDMSKEFIQVS